MKLDDTERGCVIFHYLTDALMERYKRYVISLCGDKIECLGRSAGCLGCIHLIDEWLDEHSVSEFIDADAAEVFGDEQHFMDEMTYQVYDDKWVRGYAETIRFAKEKLEYAQEEVDKMAWLNDGVI